VNRRIFKLTLGLPRPLLCGIGWDRFFELGWEEEVQLHDGRIIVVKRKQVYEQPGTRFSRYGGRIIKRDSAPTLDAGGSTGLVAQLFKGFSPTLHAKYQGTWYAVLRGSY